MDSVIYKYNDVNEVSNSEEKNRRTYLFRQLLICSVVWTHYFACGLCFGAPTVIIPQIRREADDTEAVDEETASWLYSVFGFAAIPWVFIIPLTISRFGRKIPFLIISLNMVLVFIALYFSITPKQILIIEIMQGVNHAANVTISVIIISEYTSPRYRGMFLTIKSATFFWGVWISNTIGTFCSWRYIPVFGFICSCFTLLSMFWTESPYWYACKGRYHDCRIAHQWLHGTNENSKIEVDNLIASQRETLNNCDSVNSLRISKIFETITCKKFYKPVLISILMVTQYHLSGKYVCSIYAIDILKRISKSEDTAYIGMLLLDAVTVCGMYIGCFLSKIFNRRTLYLLFSLIGIIFLFIISLYLYLVELSILTEMNILSITLFIAFFVPISCGPMIMTTSIYGEIIPLRFKTVSFVIIALVNEVYITSFLKIAPFLFKSLGLHGAFLFYGIAAGFCTFILYLVLPETKDKTLQEIEEYFK